MADRELNIAAVGTGGIWGAHAHNLSVLGGSRVVAVCDISEQNRQRAADALGARPYADIGTMLDAEPDLDAVIACTPPTVRRQVVEAAAPRGLPVFVEKPPAASLDDARAIIGIAEQAGSPVVVGFMYRYLPAVDRIKELIAGRPINLVQSDFLCAAATEWGIPGWFFIKERSGGHVMDQAIHVMDLVRFLAGDITQVFTLGNNVICPKGPEFTVEDSSSTALRFASGASGTHVHSWSHHEFVGHVTLIGKDYRLTLTLDSRVQGFVGDEQIDETFPGPPPGCSHHYAEMKAFLNAVRTGDFSGLRSPYADAARSLATVLAMNWSIETGQPVAVPVP
ncbi:MAG: Gfo/Idh/MocA family oxidoreductase [Armatimonadetes bacterium]|nr:Gfo/Idh/MocA family oxidoreductase [Armatimonadota bacterium]